jgi:hypothetical protein
MPLGDVVRAAVDCDQAHVVDQLGQPRRGGRKRLDPVLTARPFGGDGFAWRS